MKNRTDKNFIAQPKINLQSFKSTPDSLKQRFKGFGRKPSFGAPDYMLSIKQLLTPCPAFAKLFHLREFVRLARVVFLIIPYSYSNFSIFKF